MRIDFRTKRRGAGIRSYLGASVRASGAGDIASCFTLLGWLRIEKLVHGTRKERPVLRFGLIACALVPSLLVK